MSDPPPEAGSDASGLLCVGCGYDIRGLPEMGACPECGTPIARSRSGDRLVYSDPDWLKRVVSGQRLIAIGLQFVLWTMLVTMFSFLVLLITTIAEIGTWFETTLTYLVRAAGFVAFIGGGLVLIGAFFVTVLDPRDSSLETYAAPRLWARIGILGGLVLTVVRRTLDAFVMSNTIEPVLILIGYLAAAGFAVGLVALLRCQVKLTARIPEPDLAQALEASVVRFRWALPLLIGFSALNTVIDLIGVPVGRSAQGVASFLRIFGGLGACVSLIVGLMVFFSGLALIGKMKKLSQALRDVTREAGGVGTA